MSPLPSAPRSPIRARSAGIACALLLLGAAACDPDPEDPDPPGETFDLVADELGGALLSIWGRSAGDLYTVGADDGSGPVVLHFDGQGWARLDTGTSGDLWWVWGDAQAVWMAGAGGRVVRHDPGAGTFEEEQAADPGLTLFGIFGAGEALYAVAADITGERSGEILTRGPDGWQTALAVEDAADGSRRQPYKIWGASAEDLWVVGTRGLTLHFDGTEWVEHPAPVPATTTLFTVHGAGPDHVVAVGGFGNAAVTRWDGAALVNDSPPPDAIAPGFNGVFVHPVHGTAAAGNNGAVWWRGEAGWERDPRPVPTNWSFHAAWIDDRGGVWAAGGDLINLDQGVLVYAGDDDVPALQAR